MDGKNLQENFKKYIKKRLLFILTYVNINEDTDRKNVKYKKSKKNDKFFKKVLTLIF